LIIQTSQGKEQLNLYLPEYEGFIEDGVQVFAVDFGLKFPFPVGQKLNFNVRVAAAQEVFDRQVVRLQNLQIIIILNSTSK